MTQTITGKGKSKSRGNWRCTGDGNVKLKGFSCPTKPHQSRAQSSLKWIACQKPGKDQSVRNQVTSTGDWIVWRWWNKTVGKKAGKSHVILHFVKKPIENVHFLPALCTLSTSQQLKNPTVIKISPFHSIYKRKFISNAVQDGGYSIRCALHNLKLRKKQGWTEGAFRK